MSNWHLSFNLWGSQHCLRVVIVVPEISWDLYPFLLFYERVHYEPLLFCNGNRKYCHNSHQTHLGEHICSQETVSKCKKIDLDTAQIYLQRRVIVLFDESKFHLKHFLYYLKITYHSNNFLDTSVDCNFYHFFCKSSSKSCYNTLQKVTYVIHPELTSIQVLWKSQFILQHLGSLQKN